MSRIEFNDTAMDAITKMSDGNPGAINVLLDIITNAKEIDPQSMLAGLGTLLSLDTHEIYGSDIWIFHKDVSGGDLETLLGCMRAVQLGIKSKSWLRGLIIEGQSRRISEESQLSITDAITEVKKQLPDFGDKREKAA